MYKFGNGLIKCLDCGKNYKRKLERKREVLICSGFSNYGKEFCCYNPLPVEELTYTISKHFAVLGRRIDGEIKEYIDRIEVVKGKFTIYYKDSTVSIVDMTGDYGIKIKY